MGSALINAGLLTLISIITVYSMGMDMDGHTITSACLMFGFSLCWKKSNEHLDNSSWCMALCPLS